MLNEGTDPKDQLDSNFDEFAGMYRWNQSRLKLAVYI